MKQIRKPVQQRAIEYYKARPGEVIHVNDVAVELDHHDPSTISTAMSRVVRLYPETGIKKGGPRGTYVYRGNIPDEEFKDHGNRLPEPRGIPSSPAQVESPPPAHEEALLEVNKVLGTWKARPGETYTGFYTVKAGKDQGKRIVIDEEGNLFILHEF